MDERYDVVVIGGGAAGLGGALTLARARRSVLVVDAGDPRNAPAAHAHGMLTRDGTPPLELLATGRAEVERYGAHVADGEVVAVHHEDGAFTVDLADGRSVVARAVLSATGLRDELPDVPGLAERWGTDVLHCPYCHGWEVRDRPVVILGTHPMAAHAALLWRQWTADVTLVRHTAPPLAAQDVERLTARGVRLLDTTAEVIDGPAGDLTVRLADGTTVGAAAVVTGTRLLARAGHLAPLGLHAVPFEMAGQEVGRAVPAGPDGATAMPGVWVAGNVTDLRATVVVAAAAGTTVGAAINADLVARDADAAVDAHRTSAGTARATAESTAGTTAAAPDPATAATGKHAAHHEHGVELPDELAGMFEPDFWEERYSGPTPTWSGRPNDTLVAETRDLTPGRALDVAAGEGGDALWLAEQGWHVTASDWAATALARGASSAAERGLTDRVTWRRADIADASAWADDEPYDLVTSHYLHLPPDERTAAVRRMASLVRPGGTLLVVGHHVRDLDTSMPRPRVPELFTDAHELAALLDPADWQVVTAEARPHTALDPDGAEVVLHDAVLRARRREDL